MLIREADLGMVMMLGIPISALALVAGVVFATKYAARTHVEANPETTEQEIEELVKGAPGAFHASLPIVLPIVLTVLRSLEPIPGDSGPRARTRNPMDALP